MMNTKDLRKNARKIEDLDYWLNFARAGVRSYPHNPYWPRMAAVTRAEIKRRENNHNVVYFRRDE